MWFSGYGDIMDDKDKVEENITKIVKKIVEEVKSNINIINEKPKPSSSRFIKGAEIRSATEITVEKFDLKKFARGFNILRPKVLAKWLTSIVRTILILCIMVGSIYGVGYWRGIRNKPINIELSRGKEVYIKVDGHYLHITEDALVYIEDMDGNRIKQISAKDIKGLQEQLRPYGFQLDPILVGGVGYGLDGIDGEVGIGVNWFRAWKIQVDTFLTQKGIYPIGISYSLKDLRLKNSSTGIAAGTGYSSFSGERDTRIIWYWRTKL